MVDILNNKKDSYPFIYNEELQNIAQCFRDCRVFIKTVCNTSLCVYLTEVLQNSCLFSCVFQDTQIQFSCTKEGYIYSQSPQIIIQNSFVDFNQFPPSRGNIRLQLLPDCIVKIPQSIHVSLYSKDKPQIIPSQHQDINKKTFDNISLSEGYNTKLNYNTDTNTIIFNIGQALGEGKTKFFKQWKQFQDLILSETEIQNYFKGSYSVNGIAGNFNMQTGNSLFIIPQVILKSKGTDIFGNSDTKYIANLRLNIFQSGETE